MVINKEKNYWRVMPNNAPGDATAFQYTSHEQLRNYDVTHMGKGRAVIVLSEVQYIIIIGDWIVMDNLTSRGLVMSNEDFEAKYTTLRPSREWQRWDVINPPSEGTRMLCKWRKGEPKRIGEVLVPNEVFTFHTEPDERFTRLGVNPPCVVGSILHYTHDGSRMLYATQTMPLYFYVITPAPEEDK